MFKAKIVEANEGGHGFWPSEKEQTGHYAAIVIHKGERLTATGCCLECVGVVVA